MAGGKAGAAIGATVGSIVPGAGTVVGAAVGFVAGVAITAVEIGKGLKNVGNVVSGFVSGLGSVFG